MESVEAKSTLQLPTHLVFTCSPYNGLDTRSFTLRVQVLTGSGEPVLTARLVQAEQIEEAIATEFAENYPMHLAKHQSRSILVRLRSSL